MKKEACALLLEIVLEKQTEKGEGSISEPRSPSSFGLLLIPTKSQTLHYIIMEGLLKMVKSQPKLSPFISRGGGERQNLP